jgi:putative ATPase
VGFPEARIILSQGITYLAASPKSNRSYQAIGKAINCVKRTGKLSIPAHLLNPVTSFNKELGVGLGYKNPHEDKSDYRKNSYLPKSLKGQKFYVPSELGMEKQLKANLEALRPLGDD